MAEASHSEAKKSRGLLYLLRKEYFPDETVPSSAIYECSVCRNITAFKRGEKFTVCPDCPAQVGGQGWFRTNEFVHFVSKNLNTEFDRLETVSIRVAEVIADVASNIWFVYFHVVWFGLWIWMNAGHHLFGVTNFDPYPFGLLTMIVSLEAIFLSTFILVAQGLQSKRSELRADIEYNVNLKTEKDVAEILSILNDIREGKLTIKGKRVVLERDYSTFQPPRRERKKRVRE